MEGGRAAFGCQEGVQSRCITYGEFSAISWRAVQNLEIQKLLERLIQQVAVLGRSLCAGPCDCDRADVVTGSHKTGLMGGWVERPSGHSDNIP